MEKVKVIIGYRELEVECAQDSITYENGKYIVNMNKFKGNQLVECKNYDDYVAFVISDQISQRLYDEFEWTCDEVWEHCVEYAREFEKNELKEGDKSLYDCVQDFIDKVINEREVN